MNEKVLEVPLSPATVEALLGDIRKYLPDTRPESDSVGLAYVQTTLSDGTPVFGVNGRAEAKPGLPAEPVTLVSLKSTGASAIVRKGDKCYEVIYFHNTVYYSEVKCP